MGKCVGCPCREHMICPLPRAVRVHEVLMQALNGRQTWIRVAEVLGVSARAVRRLRWRYEP